MGDCDIIRIVGKDKENGDIGEAIYYKTIEKYKGIFKVHKNMPTMVAFPTTSGTGSETTVAAVVRNEKTGEKFPIESMRAVPKFAFLEPRLLLNLQFLLAIPHS